MLQPKMHTRSELWQQEKRRIEFGTTTWREGR